MIDLDGGAASPQRWRCTAMIPAQCERPATMIARGDRRLRREVALVLGVKLVALAALWFAFFRGHQVRVDSQRALEQLQPGAMPAGAAGPENRTDAR